jgi:CPA1 family monovalent cation:H+ antiporter
MFEIKMSQGAKLGKGGILSVGAVTLALALALSIPTDLEYWWTIQSIAFGVVLHTLLIQAPSIGWLLRRSG